MKSEPTSPAARHTRFYLAYLTANDSQEYQADFLNFLHMTTLHPGVDKIQLYVAVSRVRAFSDTDRRALDALMCMATACPWFDVRLVIWKGNVGRDFSSAAACLSALGCEAGPQDFTLVRNRSAYGPLRPNWYAQYITQFERFEDSGLVGSTINFLGHPLRPADGPTTHVQTYAYLSQWRHLAPLVEDYPGARCTDRLKLICDGEIGLSRSMLERGRSLSCLYWPTERFTLARLRSPELPARDIKRDAGELSLRYKFGAYFWQPKQLPSQLAWWRALRAGAARPHAARHVQLQEYG
jgi:hypothetical protein